MTNPRDGTAAAADAGWLALRGRVCVIRGAAGGIGEAIACDITDAGSVAKAAAAVEQASGGADVLVNNAGLLRPGAIDRLSVEEWNATLAVNLTGYFLCAQVFGRQMVAKQGGAMVHIASIAAHHPQTFSGSYSPSKAGVTMLSRQIAAEWGRHGLRSNVVTPA